MCAKNLAISCFDYVCVCMCVCVCVCVCVHATECRCHTFIGVSHDTVGTGKKKVFSWLFPGFIDRMHAFSASVACDDSLMQRSECKV